MSLTRTVPPGVPSLDQSSLPFPDVAEKKSRPWKMTSSCGLELLEPVRMSLTHQVPSAVPSDRQSSVPVTPSVAAK